jgi:signal transduction histidine kinase
MGLMLAVFGVGLSIVATVTHRSLRESFRLRFEKDVLLRELEASRSRLEEMNRTLERRVAERTAALERQTEALRAARRMEAIGRLAGGIAHDFNNLLSIILGNAGSLLRQLAPADQSRASLIDIRDAADRGASLVRQLSLFSRREPATPRTVDLNAVVADMVRHGLRHARARLRALLHHQGARQGDRPRPRHRLRDRRRVARSHPGRLAPQRRELLSRLLPHGQRRLIRRGRAAAG